MTTTTTSTPTPGAAPVAPAADTAAVTAGAITPHRLAELRRDFEASPTCRLAQNAVTQTNIDDVALDRRIFTGTDHTFSHLLDDWPVTNQKRSGRCWMFAGLNLLRAGAMKKMDLKEFEFSQNFTLFWDKFERANYFLEAIIETADRPVDDRTVAFLLDRPLDDGGQWNMFVNIIRKYGLAPKAVMPESFSSSDTPRMNANVIAKLREFARDLRALRSSGAPMEAARAQKDQMIETIFRMLSIHLGTPPAQFNWQWNDKDRNFHRDGEMTPQRFADKYITLPVDEYVCLVHDPREQHEYNRTYTVQYLGNVVGGERVIYLNVDIDLIKQLAMHAIMDGEPVWFGCDVGKMMRRDLGLWDARLFDYENVYDTTFAMSKADRLVHHETQMTHAMLFTGVDVVHDRARRWRVENSWGEDNGRKGFYVMNDSWFDEHVFEIAARRSALPAELQDALTQEPIVLPPWDPMGSLAR